MNVLFVCNQGRNRSRTTAQLFRNRFETKSASLYSNEPVTKQQLGCADTIVVMEDTQRIEIGRRFPDVYLQKSILVFEIKDIYCCNQPELIEALQAKMRDITEK